MGPRKRGIIWSMALVLGCAVPATADPKPLTREEQAKVDQAIDKGVAYLKSKQTREGEWPRQWPTAWLVGQCALPAYALLEAGVAPDDPVIQKAAHFLRAKALKTERTYELSLALLFFDRLGDPKDEKLIQSLALRLVAGQHRTGGWSYSCLNMSEANEAALLKALEQLSKQINSGGKSVSEALRALEVPKSLKSLTVFQDPKKLAWVEDGHNRQNGNPIDSPNLLGVTDNSNTQFAVLALWAARRHDFPLEPMLPLIVERFERTQNENGWWPYSYIWRPGMYPRRSMICVGLLGLAIGDGLKLPTPGAALPDQESLRVLRGLTALCQEVDIPTGQMKRPVPPQDLYFLWSVERVGMLYDLPTFGDKDWYRWGAEILVTNQKSNGRWVDIPRTTKYYMSDYGVTANTAFALLFLKRSHPMKELTPKLSLKGKELNQGIARLLSGTPPQKDLMTTPSRSNKPHR